MLKRLYIKNVVLVESCTIEFQKGLNVLTGETGAGKSVILSCLSFVLGKNIDTSFIRKGHDTGSIEAAFEIDRSQEVHVILDSAGIEHHVSEDLLIKREFTTGGKSRTWINHQIAQVSVLKKLSPYLIEACGQHAHMRLLEKETPQELLDAYAETENDLRSFQNAFLEQKRILDEIAAIENSQKERFRECVTCRREIEEIAQAKLIEGEDVDLFQELSRLTTNKDLIDLIQIIMKGFDGERSPLTQLIRQKSYFDKLVQLDSTLKPAREQFERALSDLQETQYVLEQALSKVQFDTSRLDEIEERMHRISSLERKYGTTIREIELYKQAQEKRLFDLEHQDLYLLELKEILTHTEKQTEFLAKKLSEKRIEKAPELSQAITEELRELNMPNCQFEVVINKKERTLVGDEEILFMLCPNLGEKFSNIQESASGGELSRLALALQIKLINTGSTKTILFDEIDANIGGHTAEIVGEKLAKLGNKKQVLCITHFPQVATKANAHFCIEKQEIAGRTVSTVYSLDGKRACQKEIARMLGKKNNPVLYETQV